MALSKQEIVDGLRELGLPAGCVVMVHSALSALGEVEGGAETVIEALLEAVGPEGTLLMPAMAQQQPFRIESSPSTVGLITEVFRTYPGAIRSLHPTHSVAGIGPLTEELIEGHINQPTALGPESPWGRLARRDDGYILFIGVDQDRNTLLHAAEEIVEGAYLNTITRDYVDADGNVQTKVLEKFPGPHRDFIGLDPLFEAAGAMRIGKFGNAVCRLMPAERILQLTVAALKRDPAAVLCDNPHCRDCVRQRAAIKHDLLSREDFTLSAVMDDVGYGADELGEALWLIKAEGIRDIEIGPEWAVKLAEERTFRQDLAATLAADEMMVAVCHADVPMADATLAEEAVGALDRAIEVSSIFAPRYLKLPAYLVAEGVDPESRYDHAVELLSALARRAAAAQVRLLIENHPQAVWCDAESCARVLAAVEMPGVTLSYNPAHFVHAGEHPFLQTYSRGRIKRHVGQLMLVDGCEPPWPQHTIIGQGQGEVKELMSIFRCRSFGGYFTLALNDTRSPENFSAQAKAFWHLLDNL